MGLFSSLLALSCLAAAHDSRRLASEPGPAVWPMGWSFQLATLDGRQFVSLRALSGPVLVNFWGVDCPPCVAELPMLQAFAREHPHWTLLLVGTDPPAAARQFVARHLQRDLPANVRLLRGASAARSLMRETGNRHAALPHSVVRHAGPSAGICAVHTGLLQPEILSRWHDACGPSTPR